jgi:hypothetical protein
MKWNGLFAGAALAVASLAASGAGATTISWADLTADNGTNTVTGSITAGLSTVNLTVSGVDYTFANINNTGNNFWTGAYTYNGTYNQPSTSDIVALNLAGTTTITFDKPVNNLYLALNSWNGAAVTFDHAFTIASEGCGPFGCGTFSPTGANTGFNGVGEAAGILEFPGTLSSLTFTDTVPESWHGLTVGILGVASSRGGIPEPRTWMMMLVGLGGMGALLRSRRNVIRPA